MIPVPAVPAESIKNAAESRLSYPLGFFDKRDKINKYKGCNN